MHAVSSSRDSRPCRGSQPVEVDDCYREDSRRCAGGAPHRVVALQLGVGENAQRSGVAEWGSAAGGEPGGGSDGVKTGSFRPGATSDRSESCCVESEVTGDQRYDRLPVDREDERLHNRRQIATNGASRVFRRFGSLREEPDICGEVDGLKESLSRCGEIRRHE